MKVLEENELEEQSAEDIQKQIAEREEQEKENLEKALKAAAKFEPQIPIARTLLINGVLGDARSAQIRYQQANSQLSIARQVKRATDEGNKPQGPDGEDLKVSITQIKKWEEEVNMAIHELKALAQIHSHFSVK